MNRLLIYEVVIIVCTLAIVLPLVSSIRNISVTEYNQAINWDNASRGITFDLKEGQTVTGSLDYTGETTGAWFLIGDPNNNEIGSRTNEGNHGTFSFTAQIDGQYYIDIENDSPHTQYINYSYTISSPHVLGFDASILITLVIVIGLVLSMINVYYNAVRIRKKRI